MTLRDKIAFLWALNIKGATMEKLSEKVKEAIMRTPVKDYYFDGHPDHCFDKAGFLAEIERKVNKPSLTPLCEEIKSHCAENDLELADDIWDCINEACKDLVLFPKESREMADDFASFYDNRSLYNSLGNLRVNCKAGKYPTEGD